MIEIGALEKGNKMMETYRRRISLFIFTAFCFWLLSLALPLAAQSQKTGKLIVKIDGMRNAEGNILVALRTDESTIIATQVATIDPKNLAAEAVFDNLGEGDYGVAVIHDENKNEKLDFNEYGMPLEGYGHSNNPSKRQGPPEFSETKFVFSAPTTSVNIKLIYWP